MRPIIFFISLVLSFGYFAFQLVRRCRYIKLGKPDNRSDQPGERWGYLLKQLFLHQKIGEYPLSRFFHWPIFWGFLILLFSSLDMILSFLFNYRLPGLSNSPWFLFVRDTAILLVLFGTIGFLLRRLTFKPDWLHNSFKAYGILGLILIIVVAELFYLAIDVFFTPGLAAKSAWLTHYLSQQLAFIDEGLLLGLREGAFWVHFLAMFSFYFIIPHTKHLHLVFAPFNIYWRSLKPSGQLTTIPVEKTEACGVAVVEDFTWKQLCDVFSCVMCGRCHGVCPAERSLERLKPKKINGRLRTYLEKEGSRLWQFRYGKRVKGTANLANQREPLKVVGELFHDDFIWSCTTCGSCNQACPVAIDHLGKIIDMRRNMVSENKFLPAEVKTIFKNVEGTGNVLGFNRLDSAEDSWYETGDWPALPENSNAEYLLYLGCQLGYNRNYQHIGLALTKLLKTGGVDFAILGAEENCCGETVRRMGNELLFQKMARKNIAHWNSVGVQKIITGCPHCYNTLKNEYPEFGGNYEVIHYTTLLLELFRQGKLIVSRKLNKVVTYHDPCYLGKHNGIFEEPRELLTAIPGIELVEMPHTKANAFCCGGGGGRFWIKNTFDNPIIANRVKEALATKGEMIVTSCPYCNIVFSEEIEGNPLDFLVKVVDLAQLLVEVVNIKEQSITFKHDYTKRLRSRQSFCFFVNGSFSQVDWEGHS